MEKEAQVLMQAPPEATREDARSALERAGGDIVGAIGLLWGATGPGAPKGVVGSRAVELMDAKDAESVGKIAEMRQICDRINIQMEQLFHGQKASKST